MTEELQVVDEIKLIVPEATLVRLRQLLAQRQSLEATMQQIAQTVFEVMGLEGPHHLDIATGEVTPAPRPIPMDRAERRRQKKVESKAE